MRHDRRLRTQVAVATGMALLSGLAVVGTAGPAAAASGCNSTYTDQKSFVEWAGRATLPAWRGSGYVSLNCEMSQGASGPEVEALQRTLNECYGESLILDGIFGSRTRDALRRAQSDERITVDGIYGPETLGALHWYYRPVTTGGYDECSRV